MMKPSRRYLSGIFAAVFLAALMLVLGCGSGEADAALAAADSMKYDKPRDAIRLLEGIKGKLSTDRRQAEYALIMATAELQAGEKQKNDSLIQVALDYFKDTADSLRRAETYYAAGRTYCAFHDEKKALSYYNMAANTLPGSGCLALKYNLYKEWGLLVRAEPPHTESLRLFRRAMQSAAAAKDTLKMIEMANLTGWQTMFAGDLQSAYRQFDATIRMAEKAGNKPQLSTSYKNMAVACTYLKQNNEALKNINKAIEYNTSAANIPVLSSIKGSIFTDLNQPDSARIYLAKRKKTNQHYDYATYYMLMSKLEKSQKRFAQALEYSEKYALYMDSAFEDIGNNKFTELQQLYEYSNLRAEKNALIIENNRKSTYILIIVVLALVLFIITNFYHARKKRKIRQLVELKDRLLWQSVEQTRSKNYELMKLQSDFREKEITLRENLSHKEEEMQQLKQRQQELKIKIFEMDAVIEKIENIRRMSEKKKILSASQIALSKQELTELLKSVDLCFDGFVSRLTQAYPSLTPDDMYLCCLLKMGISNQDICLLLQLSDYTLRKRKYRLKTNKLNYEGALEEFVSAF